MLRGTAREAVAEFFGTFILMMFGIGVVAQVVLSGDENGTYISINVAWGLAVTMGIYACNGISGAHINPAVTLALAVHGKLSWKKVAPYMVAQFVGAFIASLVVFIVYREALDHFDGGTRQILGEKATAGIWATYPQEFLSTFPGGFIDQVVGTALLVGMVFAITDERNFAPKSNLAPVLIGALVAVIGMSFGLNAGYAINPARDFSPRLFTAMAGWGSDVFTVKDHFWWVPIAGPFVGGILGGYVYEFLIAKHHPAKEKNEIRSEQVIPHGE